MKFDMAFLSFTAYLRRHGLTSNFRSFSTSTVNSPSYTPKPPIELVSKAHDCRVILGWLALEAQTASDVHTAHGKRRGALAWSQCRICVVLEAAPRYMIEPHLSNFTTASTQFLELYTALCESFQGTNRWNLARKVHTFAHMIDDVRGDLLNPRFYSGWTDETLMHKVVVMTFKRDCRTASETVLRSWWPAFAIKHREG